MSPHLDAGLLSPSDVADMVGVSRGAVSNWRKRASDFPQPVAGTSSNPLFSAEEVSNWLRSHGHRIKRDLGEASVWSAMNLLRGEVSAGDAVELLLTLAVGRKQGTHPPQQFAGVRPETLELVEAAISRVDVSDLGAAVDFALERLAKAQGKMGAELGFVGSRTSTMLAQIAATRPGGVLYDPACGIAAALIEAVVAGAQPDRVVGHDISAHAVWVASQRAEIYDVVIELAQTDVLSEDADPSLLADTVILEPPFSMRLNQSARLTDNRFEYGPPPRTSADTAWLQHAVAHLTDAGRAYVLTPPGPLFRGGEEGKIRGELVRRGCVEAVVGLPGKLLPHTSMPLALWVLRRPDTGGSAGTVLVIDASETSSPETHVHRWLAGAEERGAVPHASVPIPDVLAADSVLNPQRWVDQTERDVADVRATYQDGLIQMDESLQHVNNALSSFEYEEPGVRSRMITVGALVDHGILEFRLGRPKDRYDDASMSLRERIVTASDVRDGHLRATPLGQPRDNNPDWTHEGDVLVTTMHTVRARVDDIGGHIPSTGVSRLRVRDREVLSPEYLASALTGSWNDRFLRGSTIQRAHVKDLEVPLLPIDEQRSIQRALSTLGALREHATHLAEGASAVATSLLEGIRYNAALSESADATTASGTDGPIGPRETR